MGNFYKSKEEVLEAAAIDGSCNTCSDGANEILNKYPFQGPRTIGRFVICANACKKKATFCMHKEKIEDAMLAVTSNMHGDAPADEEPFSHVGRYRPHHNHNSQQSL